MPTVRETLAAAARTLDAAGVPRPRREAEVLLGHLLGVGREVVFGHPERPLGAAGEGALAAAVARRAGREPTAYILGEREFWSLSFRVGPDTLIPRPDSETVVEAALAEVKDRRAPLELLDLGTGCGCLLLALLSELGAARGVGVDLEGGALAVARLNAIRLGLAARARFVRGDWGRALCGRFDLIVANPPYVGTREFACLSPEIGEFEPRVALDGGDDGLASYRALASDIARLLAPGGVAVLEIGAGQAEAVAAIMAVNGMRPAGQRRDLAGITRCVILRPSEKIVESRKILLGMEACVS